MNVENLVKTHQRIASTQGAEFSDIPKCVVANGLPVRLVGDFSSAWEHFVNLPQGSRPYYCEGPESDCPICAAVQELVVSGEEQKQKIAADCKAKEKFYFNVLDRTPVGRKNHSKTKKSCVLAQNEKGFNIGSQLFQAISAIVLMRQQMGQPDDPNGYDIILQKTGSGVNTKYGAQFSGDTTPLTEEEEAYELWPLEQIAKLSTYAERKTVANFILGGQEPVDEATEFNPADYKAKPPQQAKPVTKPAAAKPPAQKQEEPAKKTLSLKKEYQDTTPGRDVDMSTHVVIPCTECSADLLFSLEDTTDLKCHACGQVYDHPSKT